MNTFITFHVNLQTWKFSVTLACIAKEMHAFSVVGEMANTHASHCSHPELEGVNALALSYPPLTPPHLCNLALKMNSQN